MSVENCQATKTWDLGLGIWDLGNGKWEKRVPPVPGDDCIMPGATTHPQFLTILGDTDNEVPLVRMC